MGACIYAYSQCLQQEARCGGGVSITMTAVYCSRGDCFGNSRKTVVKRTKLDIEVGLVLFWRHDFRVPFIPRCVSERKCPYGYFRLLWKCTCVCVKMRKTRLRRGALQCFGFMVLEPFFSLDVRVTTVSHAWASSCIPPNVLKPTGPHGCSNQVLGGEYTSSSFEVRG